MKRMLILLIIILFFKSELSSAQHIIDLSNVDVIIYNEYDTEYRLYEKKGENKFIEVFLELEDNYRNNFIDIEIDQSDKVKTLSDIVDDDEKLIYTKDLKETTVNKLLNKQLEIIETHEPWYKEGGDSHKLVLKFLTNHVSTIQEFYYGKRELYGGFGSYIKFEDDDKEKWRIYNTNHYTTIDLDFGNNKHIFVLNDGDDIDFLFLPFKNKTLLVSSDDGISNLIETEIYGANYRDTFSRFDYDRFYTLQENESGGYRLVSPLKENLLKFDYDTIVYNQYFSIAKKKNQITIVNSYQKKIEINNIKSAYLYRNGIEVLNDLGANYYDEDLKIIKKFPQKIYTLCGTVPWKNYKIEYDTNLKTHKLLKTYGGFDDGVKKKREYFLKDIKRKDKVTFLSDVLEYNWNGNDDFTETKYVYPNLLKITRKNKNGIYEYNYHNDVKPLDTIKKSNWQTTISFLLENISAKVVLPIVNDSITFNKRSGLIYFYNNNKAGIYPRHKTVQYDEIYQKTNSFYVIRRDKKRGWLDINTNHEYFDD